MKKIILMGLFCVFFFSNAMATKDYQPPVDSVIDKFSFEPGYVRPVNMKCGFKPFPPFGCYVGQCVCDGYGNCNWTFVCN